MTGRPTPTWPCPRCGTPLLPTVAGCPTCERERTASVAAARRAGRRRSAVGSVVGVVVALAVVVGAVAFVLHQLDQRAERASAGGETDTALTPEEKKAQEDRDAYAAAVEARNVRTEALAGFCDQAAEEGWADAVTPMPDQPAHVPGADGQYIVIFGDEMSLAPGSHPEDGYNVFTHASSITLAVCRHSSEPIDSGKICTYVPKYPDQYDGPPESDQRLFYTKSLWTVYELKTGTKIGQTETEPQFGIACAEESTMGDIQVDSGNYSECTECWVQDHLEGGRFR